MRLADVARLRLRNQHVSGARLKSAEEVVAWLGCVQSQEYALAKWTLGARADGLSDADVDAALWDGRILRTHILRPTWHFVTPADLRWIMQLTAPRVARSLRGPNMQMPDEPFIQRSLDVIRAELAGGGRMTRAQITRLLIERGCISEEQWTVPVFIRAEYDLVLCSGGLEGNKQTYALVDERAPVATGWTFDPDQALADLVLRYFTSHGPATIADFTWWSSITVADTKHGLEMNGSAVQRLDVDGSEYWWAGDLGSVDDPSPTIQLMQGFDEFIVAYRSPRDPINLGGLVAPTALSLQPFLHAVVLDGQMIGWWRRVAAKPGFAIETRLARPLKRAEKSALGAAVDRYAEFVAKPVTLVS